jgi:hypothetical protein
VPAGTDADGSRWSIERALGFWDIGVLLMYTRAVEWSSRTFLLSVPAEVAERLLCHRSSLEASECQGDPDDTQSYVSMLRSAGDAKEGGNGSGAYLPGTLDDTPVAQRRIVSLAEVRVLRERLNHVSQLFVVCSAADGVEVLSLARLEQRCEDGWSGILLAEAGDLPDAMIAHLIAGSALPEPGTEAAPQTKRTVMTGTSGGGAGAGSLAIPISALSWAWTPPSGSFRGSTGGPANKGRPTGHSEPWLCSAESVICGRSKVSTQAPGNRLFRMLSGTRFSCPRHG